MIGHNDLRAAAERMLKYAAEHSGRPLDGQCIPCSIALAKAYLAEHDDTPVLEAWCNSAIGEDSTLVLYQGDVPTVHVFVSGRESGCWVAPKTRGDLRRLYGALGIEMKADG